MQKRWTGVRNFLNKVGWQALSVLFAVLAWVFVNSESSVEQNRLVKLQYVGLPEGLAFQRSPLREIRMDLTGPVHRIRSVKDEDLIYSIDLSAARPGTRKIQVDPEELRTDVDIKASHPTPRSFNIYLEEVFVKTLPVKAVLVGEPKQGFEVRRISIRPDRVQVSGPRSLLAKVESLEVPVAVEGRDKSYSVSVKPTLELPESNFKENLLAEVEIGPRQEVREFDGVPVIAEGAAKRFRISPASALLLLEGPEIGFSSVVNNLRVSVNVKGLSPGRYRIRGKVQLPSDVQLKKLEPETFLVEILRED